MEKINENIIIISLKNYNSITGKSIKKYKDKKRYIAVNKQTYDIIDDAQGYGFKDVHGAYKAVYYKQNYKNILAEKKNVAKWWDEHKEFRSHWEDILWYATKDNIKVTKDDFIRELKEYNIDVESLPCNIKYLLKY